MTLIMMIITIIITVINIKKKTQKKRRYKTGRAESGQRMSYGHITPRISETRNHTRNKHSPGCKRAHLASMEKEEFHLVTVFTRSTALNLKKEKRFPLLVAVLTITSRH